MRARYIIWRETGDSGQAPIREILKRFPGVEVVSSRDPHSAVVMMEPGMEAKLRHKLPGLAIEHDVQHALAFSH